MSVAGSAVLPVPATTQQQVAAVMRVRRRQSRYTSRCCSLEHGPVTVWGTVTGVGLGQGRSMPGYEAYDFTKCDQFSHAQFP